MTTAVLAAVVLVLAGMLIRSQRQTARAIRLAEWWAAEVDRIEGR